MYFYFGEDARVCVLMQIATALSRRSRRPPHPTPSPLFKTRKRLADAIEKSDQDRSMRWACRAGLCVRRLVPGRRRSRFFGAGPCGLLVLARLENMPATPPSTRFVMPPPRRRVPSRATSGIAPTWDKRGCTG